MKKKDLDQKLQLKKQNISNLYKQRIKGGTNTVTLPVNHTVQETIRLTTLVTNPEVCETKGDVCTLYCETRDICN